MREKTAFQAGAIGFYPSNLCRIALPARRVAGTDYYRKVGDTHMNIMVPTVGFEETAVFVIPYGIYPRGIFCYLSRDVNKAKRQGNADPMEVKLGASLREAVERITGKNHTSGGPRSPRAILDNQLFWLSTSHISFRQGNDGRRVDNMTFAESYERQMPPSLELLPEPIWRPTMVDLDPNPSPRAKRADVTLRLHPKFYQDLIDHSVPTDERIMKVLWQSPLMMDIYVWLTYRANDICNTDDQTLHLKWSHLREQFGYGYKDESIRSFKQKFYEAWNVVRGVYHPTDRDYVRLDERSIKGATGIDKTMLRLRVKGPSVPHDPNNPLERRAFSGPSVASSTYNSRKARVPAAGKGQTTFFGDTAAAPAAPIMPTSIAELRADLSARNVCVCSHHADDHHDGGLCVRCWTGPNGCRNFRSA